MIAATHSRLGHTRPTHSFLHLLLAVLLCAAHIAKASVFTCTGGTVYIVAHPDDDLLFQSPDLYTDMLSSSCLTTVYTTSGDSGTGSAYAQSRESGNEAAYAYMGGVNDTWTQFYAIFGGQSVLVRTLVGKPWVQKVWFRLPDGDVDGSGYAVTGYETLRELYFNTISSITTQPGDATYTMATLKEALGQILTARQPVRVRTLDYLSEFDGGDHSDHLTTARLAAELQAEFAPNATLSGYMGYPVEYLAPTLKTSSTLFKNKTNAFFTYTPYDSDECQSYSSCLSAGRGEAYWLLRQYIVTPALAETTNDGVAQTPVTINSSYPNVALLATASASSSADGQPPIGMNDGNIGGYPGNSSAEWSSDHGLAGTTATLTWSSAYNISLVVLYDRPNTDDWIQGGTLTFSSGYSIVFGELENDGSATIVNLPIPQLTKFITMTVASVASSTSNSGLAEFQAYGFPSNGTITPYTGVNATSSNSTGSAGSTAINLAFSASVTASSQDTVDDSLAVRAIDGTIGGYTDDGTGDQTTEWSSNGQGAGATLTLSWASAVEVNEVSLWDRPNVEDQCTGGTLTFSDGTQITFGELPNDGATPLTVTFDTVSTTSILFTVTSVSSTTSNVGLSEIKVYGPESALTTTEIEAINWARYATATASSESYQQSAYKAIDNLIGGYTTSGGDPYEEWASSGGGTGTTFLLTWSETIEVASIVLYDRPNTNDWIQGGTITFSDGSSITAPSLNNDGSATTINLASPVNTTFLLFVVTAIGPDTSSVGLSEIQVFSVTSTSGTTVGGNSSTTTNATTITPSTTAGSNVYSSINLAFGTSVSASSQDMTDDSLAVRAIDGYIGGYTDDGTGDQTTEWASDHQTSGATLTLTFASEVSIGKVVLYDRPNAEDQVTGGTLTFSDGTVVTVPTLTNDGSAVPLYFEPINTISLLFEVTSVSSTTSNVGLSEIQTYSLESSFSADGVVPVNWARYATTTASSEAYQQSGYKAIDDLIGGYTAAGGDPYEEWATSGGGIGSTLLLSWTSTVEIASVSLYDRPNTNDWIQGGTITFSDNSAVTVTSLNNDGSATIFNLASPVNTTSLLFTVTAVGPSSSSVGLSEIEVFSTSSTSASATILSLGNSTATTTTTTITPSTTPGSNVYSSINLAFGATVVASSEDTTDDSLAVRAIDGYIGGYTDDGTGDQTTEWSSNHEGAGATLKLTFASQVSIGKVVLYDRPNAEDQVIGGTLTFDDGSVVLVPTLTNDGSAVPLYFDPVNTTSLLFEVTSVSSSTSNIGLSEIQVYALESSASASGVVATNWARYATTSASSEQYQQSSYKVIDGLSESSDPYTEWASTGGVGSTLSMTWSSAVDVASLVLYDIPDTDVWVTSATIFLGETKFNLLSLNNDGTATIFNLAQTISTTFLNMTITGIGSGTTTAGLAELEVYSTPSSSSTAVTISAALSASSTTLTRSSGSVASSAIVSSSSVSKSSSTLSATASSNINSTSSGLAFEPSGSAISTAIPSSGSSVVASGSTATLLSTFSVLPSQSSKYSDSQLGSSSSTPAASGSASSPGSSGVALSSSSSLVFTSAPTSSSSDLASSGGFSPSSITQSSTPTTSSSSSSFTSSSTPSSSSSTSPSSSSAAVSSFSRNATSSASSSSGSSSAFHRRAAIPTFTRKIIR
ncbi:hypothetical protein T439DRAFT_376762 [Meredithblackwellia eburnea MCA 4105]